MERVNFDNLNEITNHFPNIKLIKIDGLAYNYKDTKVYKEELEQNGFVLLRGLFPLKKVSNAYKVVEDYLIQNSYIKKEDQKIQLLKEKGTLLSGFKPITHHQNFLDLVEGSEIKGLFEGIIGKDSTTLETKWVRVLGPKEYTDAHSDYYRFKSLNLPLYTCWIPLVSQGLNEGTLALCKDSFKYDYDEDTLENYELPNSFEKNVENSTWLYSDYKIGDALIFDIRTIHVSFRNDSCGLRINTDTRWYSKKR